MTDYKNELEQILNRLMISANNHRGNAFLLNSDHRKALSSLEALLSQHSKKRELEAYKKGYEHGCLVERNGGIQLTNGEG